MISLKHRTPFEEANLVKMILTHGENDMKKVDSVFADEHEDIPIDKLDEFLINRDIGVDYLQANINLLKQIYYTISKCCTENRHAFRSRI